MLQARILQVCESWNRAVKYIPLEIGEKARALPTTSRGEGEICYWAVKSLY